MAPVTTLVPPSDATRLAIHCGKRVLGCFVGGWIVGTVQRLGITAGTQVAKDFTIHQQYIFFVQSPKYKLLDHEGGVEARLRIYPYNRVDDWRIELAGLRGAHTDRVTSTRELAILFPEKSLVKSLPVPGPTADTLDAPPTKPTPKLHARKQPVAENDAVTQAQLTHLSAQAAQLVKAMQSAIKAKDAIPLSSPMHRQIDGIHLVHHTSWAWRKVSVNSRLREFQNVAGAAVLEWGIIEELLHPSLKLAFFSGKQRKAEFSFADQVPHAPLGDENFPRQIGDVLLILQNSLTLKADAIAIQNLVKAVERCPLAWDDPDNEGDAKYPPLESDVEKALGLLVKGLEANAFRRRGHTDGDQERSLHIVFRGTREMSIIPKGKNKAKWLPKRAHRPVEDLSEMGVDKGLADKEHFDEGHQRSQSGQGGDTDIGNAEDEQVHVTTYLASPTVASIPAQGSQMGIQGVQYQGRGGAESLEFSPAIRGN
ncbi:hypothetical protein BKA82DRAFT_30356 [Pisolithus tinctorius]|uniref:Uncharacterized protein n=1 Tax=Pisolithus tinctorius Marx 270 TaxID=870435 RepID=A0A0C3JPR2_PISTI|nr:hypothetical protein BKA82DRAFT_30356 [Pisolithus tinctorius]KIN99486.1 hypothetical protein M404DRAFT_30356 [Pisolithus tinctorius Marx 270]